MNSGGRNSAHKSEEADRLVSQASLRGRAGLVRLGEDESEASQGVPGEERSRGPSRRFQTEHRTLFCEVRASRTMPVRTPRYRAAVRPRENPGEVPTAVSGVRPAAGSRGLVIGTRRKSEHGGDVQTFWVTPPEAPRGRPGDLLF